MLMEFVVNVTLDNKTLNEILQYYQISERMKKVLKTEQRIFVNKEIVSYKTHITMSDYVHIDFPDECCNIEPQEDILEHYYEDSLYLVVDKPVGVKCGGYRTNEKNTIASYISGYYKKINHRGGIHFAKNEDIDVSGLLIVSKNAYAQGLMENKSENAKRTYRCLVEGRMVEKGNCVIQLGVVRDGENRRRVISKTGLQAVTKYSVVGYIGNMTIVDCQPLNEVTHQIRAHLSALGHPLVGDIVYGGLDLGDKMYCECIKIELFNRQSNKKVIIEKDPTY